MLFIVSLEQTRCFLGGKMMRHTYVKQLLEFHFNGEFNLGILGIYGKNDFIDGQHLVGLGMAVPLEKWEKCCSINCRFRGTEKPVDTNWFAVFLEILSHCVCRLTKRGITQSNLFWYRIVQWVWQYLFECVFVLFSRSLIHAYSSQKHSLLHSFHNCTCVQTAYAVQWTIQRTIESSREKNMPIDPQAIRQRFRLVSIRPIES